MGKYKKFTKGQLFLSMLCNPIFIAIYGIFFYELYTLCKYGRIHNNIIILLGCMLFFLAWLVIFIIRIMKRSKNVQQETINEYGFDENLELKSIEKGKSSYKVIWQWTAIAIMIFITLFYGVKIYNSGVKYNGKLSWFLSDLKNKKTVRFEDSNIYENGIEGIFTDINKKIQLPNDLYVSDSGFSLYFDSDGVITAFDTYLYGKDDKGKNESYLISYDKSKSDSITVILNGYVNADYNEDKKLEPLITTMKVIPLKETVSKWNENKYGILYYGKRSFGYNTDGIVYINGEGKTKEALNSSLDLSSEIIGNVVSVYVPGKEDIYTPVRYIFQDDLNNIKADSLNSNDNENGNTNSSGTVNNNVNSSETANDKSNSSEKVNNKGSRSGKSSNGIDEFYLSDTVGYKLEVTDAAAGSRFYSLNTTADGGATWTVLNEDPFLGQTGVAAGITFLNEKLGFLCLSHSGGSRGDLYKTEDGGLSYKKVDFQSIKVALNNGETYEPFDLPGMPYSKDGNLEVLIGQGSDGDYNGGSKALYESKDQGNTWEYVKEVTGD